MSGVTSNAMVLDPWIWGSPWLVQRCRGAEGMLEPSLEHRKGHSMLGLKSSKTLQQVSTPEIMF